MIASGTVLTGLASSPRSPGVALVMRVAYFLLDHIRPHAERAFARSLSTGDLLVEPVEDADWPRIEELLDDYADLQLGIVDASIVTACERLGATTLATLDHRHFAAVRPRHCDALALVPA